MTWSASRRSGERQLCREHGAPGPCSCRGPRDEIQCSAEAENSAKHPIVAQTAAILAWAWCWEGQRVYYAPHIASYSDEPRHHLSFPRHRDSCKMTMFGTCDMSVHVLVMQSSMAARPVAYELAALWNATIASEFLLHGEMLFYIGSYGVSHTANNAEQQQVTIYVVAVPARVLTRQHACRNHRGLRHYWGLRVKGQHSKTTGRRGRTVGVSKKKG